MINKKMVSSNYPLGSPAWKYARMLEEKRGHNYQYLSDDQWDKLKKKGYKMWDFGGDSAKRKDVIQSEALANDVAIMLRQRGDYARVVAGRELNQQRIKMFSVIYRQK
ncbi:MAG: hypothetical protein IPJ03_16700 [Ignavibacteriales bacterium]|nr:hypothetical protein [Ignavibacteriales bacterium]